MAAAAAAAAMPTAASCRRELRRPSRAAATVASNGGRHLGRSPSLARARHRMLSLRSAGKTRGSGGDRNAASRAARRRLACARAQRSDKRGGRRQEDDALERSNFGANEPRRQLANAALAIFVHFLYGKILEAFCLASQSLAKPRQTLIRVFKASRRFSDKRRLSGRQIWA